MYAVEDFTSDGRKKSSKGLSEESLERGTTRSRTNQTYSKSRGLEFIALSSDSSHRCYSTPVSSGEIQKLSSKRKSTSDGRDERKRSRRTPSPTNSPNHQASAEASTSANTAPPQTRAAFKAKYMEGRLLGKGGFGRVFAGCRKDDNLPVAIKHISPYKTSSQLTPVELDGKSCVVPLEVALLLKLQPKAAETSAVVALLDWYNLDDELILVLERPAPCMDMVKYLTSKKAPQPEDEIKILTRQLVDALIEVHSRGVFHRDLKLENILLETGSDVPRVRIIDFGCGTFLKEGGYVTKQGTSRYTCPEWFCRGFYEAGPTTVWQLGVAVFGMLHRCLPFQHKHEIVNEDPDINKSLSLDCQDFMTSCLFKSPEDRPTLQELKHHSWLM